MTLANSELTASGEIFDWQRARLDTSGRISVADIANLIGLDGSGTHNGEASLEGTVTVDQNGARFAGDIGTRQLHARRHRGHGAQRRRRR